MIEIKNLSKDFYNGKIKHRILKNINLKIEEGEFITIMGPSGGGKSTLLQSIGLLTEATEGEVYYQGNKIDFKNEKIIERFRMKNLGLIFQNPNLIPCLSPVENLILAMDSKESYKKKEKKAKMLLDEVGLEEKYNSKINSLSGGEAQRIAVVRSIVNEPKVILCDEPTGSLDSKNSKKIIDLLLKIKNEKNCILIIVTHDKEIGKLGDRRIYLEDGKLYEMARNI